MNAKSLITLALTIGLLTIAGTLLAKASAQVNHVMVAMPQASVIYVDKDATGSTHNGRSWTTAYTDVQQALTTAVSGTEIWVAEGAYYPGAYANSTFTLTNGVALYGGFAATETQRTQRDWAAHITILSGDIDRNDLTDADGIVTDTVNITGTNAYRLVTGSGVTQTAVLDGFTITAGKAFAAWGGGMYNEDGSPTVMNVTFSGNEADMLGGGMYNYESNPALTNVTFSGNRGWSGGGGMVNYSSNPTLMDVTFNGNQAKDGDGGGMYNVESNPMLMNVTFSGNEAESGGGMYNLGSNPTLMDVTFSGNQTAEYSYGRGGGMYNSGSSPTLTNVTFNGNRAGIGGGICNDSGGVYGNNSRSSPVLTNVIFNGNRAGIGGGMCNNSSSPALTNATFSGNRATTDGGGICNYTDSDPTLVNSILWGDGPDEIYDDSSVPIITYSDVYTPTGVYPGTGNINANPLFVAPITATAAPTTTGNYRLRANSPAIDAGNTLSVTVPTDLDGHPRVRGSAVDMGVYEFGLGLAIYKAATPNSVAPGHTITYTLHVLNTGSTDLHAVITDTLPNHVTPAGILTWTPTITTPNGIWAYTFVVTVEQSYTEPLVNAAHITTAEGVSGFAIAVTNGNNIYLPILLRQ